MGILAGFFDESNKQNRIFLLFTLKFASRKNNRNVNKIPAKV